MPWQRYVADVAGEVDPVTGLPAYREIVLLVPRQSGKTTLLLAEMVHRAWAYATPEYGGPQLTRYAAQTGDDAIAKWEEHVEILERTPFKRVFSTKDVNGGKSLIWANGSRYTPTATTKKSGHGKTLDQGVIDEAFAQVDFRTEQAMVPAMNTRDHAQLFIVSTAGDTTSVFLNAKMTANRERLEADPKQRMPTRTAYFEWSAAEDADPFAEETWLDCMPAVGHTIRLETIHGALEGMLADPREGERGFRRAYLNQTDKGAAAVTVFDADDWGRSGIDDDAYLVGPRSFALDITPDRSWASVAWAGTNQDGEEQHEVIKHERDTHWVIGFLLDKLRRNGADSVTVIGHSQAGLWAEKLEDAGITVHRLSRADTAAACAAYHDGIVDGSSRHLRQGQLPLDIAISGAAWTAGEERIWSHAKASTIISPLVACTIAQWAHRLDTANDYSVEESIA